MPEKIFTVIDAIHSLAPGAVWVVRGQDGQLGDYSGLEWHSDDIDKPSEEDVYAEILRLESLHRQELIAAEEQQKQVEQARQSAIDKLAKLGLTEQEVRAVIGF